LRVRGIGWRPTHGLTLFPGLLLVSVAFLEDLSGPAGIPSDNRGSAFLLPGAGHSFSAIGLGVTVRGERERAGPSLVSPHAADEPILTCYIRHANLGVNFQGGHTEALATTPLNGREIMRRTHLSKASVYRALGVWPPSRRLSQAFLTARSSRRRAF
jgi:hypothetical protein